MDVESVEFSNRSFLSDKMDNHTPRSSMYASSTDLTDTNTSIDQIEYWFCSSPHFPSMDDMLTDSDAICSTCRPEFEGFKDRMLSKVSDLKIQFEALQKIQNDVEEQLWDAWQDNQRYQEEILNLQRKLATKEEFPFKHENLLTEPTAVPDAKTATVFLSKVMERMTEEIADLDQKQPENKKEKDVLNAAVKILGKRYEALEAKNRIKGSLVDKCAFLIESKHGNEHNSEIHRGEFMDADEIFSPSSKSVAYLFKKSTMQDTESSVILQFDPNFQFSHVSCSFSHCTKLRHHLTPSKSPNSSMSNLSNNNLSKRPLYLCPKHRKQLKEDLYQVFKKAGLDCTSFPQSTSRTCEDVLEIVAALNSVCERYFEGETAHVKEAELFLNCRNFLIAIEALMLPCSHSEYNSIHQFLCLLFLHLSETYSQELSHLFQEYVNTFCHYYGVQFSWVTISPWWGIFNPGIILGGGIGLGILKHTGINDVKALSLLGFCMFFSSTVWNSLSSRRHLRQQIIGREYDHMYGVFVDKSELKITHSSRIMLNAIHRGQLTPSFNSCSKQLSSKSSSLHEI